MSKLNWRIAYASVIGSSHQKNGSPCQDAGCYRIVNAPDENEVLLAIASDGAGSASRSEIGSQLAVDSFLTCFESKVRNTPMHEIDRSSALDWMKDLNDKIQEMAVQENLHPKEYSCTILAAIVDQEEAIFFQIGDGAIVVSEKGSSEYGYMFWPQHGEFANQTNFLIQDNLEEILEFEFVKRNFETVALFTDGIERLVLDFSSKTVHAPALLPIANWLAKSEPSFENSPSIALTAYLSSDYINSRTDDDKTLVIATRTSG